MPETKKNKRVGGATPITDTNKKPNLQAIDAKTTEIIETPIPHNIVTAMLINGENIKILPGEDHVAMRDFGLAYAKKQLIRQGSTQEPYITASFTQEVTAYLSNAIDIITQKLNNFLQTTKPLLDELNQLLSTSNTQTASDSPLYNKEAILTLYLEKAYRVDQLMQNELQPALNKYAELKTSLANFLKFDPSNQQLIATQFFVKQTDQMLLTIQKASVSEDVKAKTANIATDSLQLEQKTQAWLKAIKSSNIVASAIPMPIFS